MVRSAVRRLQALVGVDGIPRSLRPLLIVSVLSALAFNTFWAYVGIWAIGELRAGQTTVGIMYGIDAVAAALGGYLGGRMSDRVGRRAIIGAAWIAEAAAIVSLLLTGGSVPISVALVVFAGLASGPGFAATNAAVADLVAEEEREESYAALRVLYNVSAALGPSTGGLLIFAVGWWAMFVAVGLCGIGAGLIALTAMPHDRPTPADGTTEPRPSSLARLVRDGAFQLLLVSNLVGFVVYVAYEAILPIVSVSSYGLSQGAWGALAAINPVLVIALQLRLTRAVDSVSAPLKLGASVLFMGAPFLLFLVNSSPWTIAAVIAIFAFGEMVWLPTSQALASRLAPVDVRGGYLGALGATSSIAWAIGPPVALALRARSGDHGTWLFFAAASGVAAGAGVLSCLFAAARLRATAPSPPGATASELRQALDVEHLRSIVGALAEPRNREDGAAAMAGAERLILAELRAAGWNAELRPFTARTARAYAAPDRPIEPRSIDGANIVACRPGRSGCRCGALLVGAHFDTVAGSPGADDNGSGIAALIGVARLLRERELQHDVVLVAFDMEEIGLLGAASYLDGTGDRSRVAEAIVFESIGYVAREPGSQSLPPGIGLLYPGPARLIRRRGSIGDWILVVHRRTSTRLSSTFSTSLATLAGPSSVIAVREPADLPVIGRLLRGVPVVRQFSRSDHVPFWEAGIPAIQVTDTANFRNPHYHQSSDLPETLDYDRVADVAAAAAFALIAEDAALHEAGRR